MQPCVRRDFQRLCKKVSRRPLTWTLLIGEMNATLQHEYGERAAKIPRLARVPVSAEAKQPPALGIATSTVARFATRVSVICELLTLYLWGTERHLISHDPRADDLATSTGDAVMERKVTLSELSGGVPGYCTQICSKITSVGHFGARWR
jgi:hypothetical protein